MLQKLFLFSCLLMVSKNVFTPILPESDNQAQLQTLPAAPDSKLSFKLEQYYHFINLANREIYKNDFFCASAFYDSAFSFHTQPNYVDLKNYILVNHKCKYYSKNDPYIKLMFETKHVDTAALFVSIPKKVFSSGNITLINRLQRQYNHGAKPDNYLQKTFREIYSVDQELLSHFPKPEEEKAFAKERDSIRHENVLRFIHTCELKGFPTEENVGVFFDKESEWIAVMNILIQNFLKYRDQEAVRAMLEKAFKRGEVHPSLYAASMDVAVQNAQNSRLGENYMHTTINFMNDVAYRPFVYYSDSLMQLVNTNRLSIGLDSFHVTQKLEVATRFCKSASPKTVIIPMVQYANMEIYTYGFVKYAFDKEGQDLNKYKINTEKILKECNCPEKFY